MPTEGKLMFDLTYVLRGYSISNTAMLVYGLLEGLSKASANRGKAYTYISRKSIAERVGKCERTARKAVKELEAVGLISIKRMGRGLNDRIFVFEPQANQLEKEQKAAGADLSVYRSKVAEIAALNVNPKKVIKNTDKSICPHKTETTAAQPQEKGRTAPKGRPTNKRPRRTKEQIQEMRKRYREYLEDKLNYIQNCCSLLTTSEDCDALDNAIEMLVNTLTSKRKIKVNGCYLTTEQYWNVIKNITEENVFRVISKLGHAVNVKNTTAYFLASLYNETQTDTFYNSFYSTKSMGYGW